MKNYLQQYLRSLNPVGVAVGAVLLALSLTPSLLPRPAVLQGVGSGIVFGIGYLLGVALALLGARLTRWRPPQKWLKWARLVGWPLYGAVLIVAMIGGVAAQNEVRRLVELPPQDNVNILGFVVALALASLASLGLGRLVRSAWRRTLARMVEGGSTPAVALKRAALRSAVASVLIVALLGAGFFGLLNVAYRSINGQPAEGLSAPLSAERSGGPGSEVSFDELGRQGGDFVTGGPTADEISALTGQPALTPVRVYVGVGAGGTLADRVATAVRELVRTGGFEREVLVVAATTGSGWVEPQGVDSVEYLHSGDTATVALQYAYTPSFVSAVTAPELTVETASALFTGVRGHWLTLPEDERPTLVVYGLSLGAQGLMNAFGSVDALAERTEGALLVGPTYATPLWQELQDTRDAGSPPWQPVRDEGERVRWASQSGDFGKLQGEWSEPRVAILQHATDPITWLGPELIWQRPEWLTEGGRAPDVSPHMRWIPVVTAVQVFLDMMVSVDVPARHGHAFGDVMIDGWVAVTGDGGLDEATIADIRAVIEDYWVIKPVNV